MPASDISLTFIDRIFGSDIPYITYAVPFFFFLAGVELIYSYFAGRRVHRVNDSVTALSCGIIDQTTKLFVEFVVLGVYIFIYQHYRLFEIATWSLPGKLAAIGVLFLGVDFCFYWHHRLGHELKIGWATHVVHHQSEEFNLIVALRQSALEHHLMFFCYLPLALLGFPPSWYIAMFSFNLIWQFWVHTRFVGKLGPMEWIFNTPSHHRVHHGRNPKYLDKNYAGTLIIWDRLFGTFQEEEEEPVYGITKPIDSWNPFWANFHVWKEIADDAKQTPRLWDKIRIWFMPLNWVPPGVEPKPDPPEVDARTVQKFDVDLPTALVIYGVVHFAIATVASLVLTSLTDHHDPLAGPWELAIFALASLLAIGGIFERKRWALLAEIARFAGVLAWASYRYSYLNLPAFLLLGAIIAVSVGVLIRYRAFLDQPLAAAEGPHAAVSTTGSLPISGG